MTLKTKQKETEKEKVFYLSPIIRVSYCNVWKPRDEKGVYDITGIMDMPKDLSEKDKKRWNRLKELLLEAKQEAFPKVKGAIGCPIRTVKGYKTDEFFSKPLDGDKNPEYVDKIIIRATSYGRQPEIIGPDKEEIIEKGEFYSGCYAILSLTAFSYETEGNKGISFGVQHIMKVKDGQPFVGSAGRAAEHFEEIEADDFATTDEEEEDYGI